MFVFLLILSSLTFFFIFDNPFMEGLIDFPLVSDSVIIDGLTFFERGLCWQNFDNVVQESACCKTILNINRTQSTSHKAKECIITCINELTSISLP